MHRPHRLLFPLLLTLWASPLKAQWLAEDPLSLDEIVEELAEFPNRSLSHLETARSYFVRGARDDARRVRRHLERATQLDPSADELAQSMFRDFTSGRRQTPLEGWERDRDERIQASIPILKSQGLSAPTPEAMVQMGLSQRFLDHPIQANLGYEEIQEEIRARFDLEDAEVVSSIENRFQASRSLPPAGGWGEEWERQIQDLNTRTDEEEEEERVLEIEGERVPDPMQHRNKVRLALAADNPSLAIDYLVETIAAVETIRAGGESGAEGPVLEAVNLDEFTPQESPQPEGEPSDSSEATSAGPETPPAPPEPPPEPPQISEFVPEVGQVAMEALEAVRQPEIPATFARQRVNELSAIGRVGDPLLIDLDGDQEAGVQGGLFPNGKIEGKPVLFDVSGKKVRRWTEWVQPHRDGLLAVDHNQNGKIDSIRELFGNRPGIANGFRQLALYDLDGNGWVEGAEAATLLVWRDDGDGVSQAKELQTLAFYGILALKIPESGLTSIARTKAGTMKVWDWFPDLGAREESLP